MRYLLLTILLSVSLFSTSAQTFNGSGGAIPGTGSSPTCFNASVSGLSNTIGTSFGLSQVCLSLTHTSVDELEILLQAPDGTYVPLSIQNGLSGADNYTNTCFSSTASAPIKFNSAPFTGTFLPEGHLGAVNNGQNPNGTWKLCILDRRAPTNAGNLVSWSITFSTNAAPLPPAFPSCNISIPSNSNCANATSICDFNGACGSAKGSTINSWSSLTSASCFGLQNNSFVKFIADAPTVSFSVWVTSSIKGFNDPNGGIQMLFFSTPSCGGAVTTYGCYNRIYPYPTNGKPLITQIYATGLTPGQTYYLLTDGAFGDECEFRIAANSGINALNITPSNTNICLGNSVTLNATGGNGIFIWATNSSNAGLSAFTGSSVTATPTSTGTIRYSLTSETGLGCPTSASVDITINPQPSAPDINITQPTCILATGTITITPISGLTYSIDGNNYQSSNIFSGLTPGSYSVSAKNAAGCVSLSTTATISNAPAGTPAYVYSIIDPTCINSTGGIVIQQPVGSNYEYNLNGGSYQSAPSFNNLTSGSYTTTVKDKVTGCVSPSSPFTIKPAPVIPSAPTISITQPVCTTTTATITITQVAGLTYSIDGNNYQSSNIFSGLNPGSYAVTTKNAAGCVSPATTATVNAVPNTPTAPTISNITQPSCTTSTGTMTITQVAGLTYSIDGNNYQSSNIFGSLNPGNYAVTAKNTAGCVSPATTATIDNQPNCDTDDLFVPNAFTPNGDGKNDILYVKGTNIKSMQLIIFNQWGEKVFESVKQDQGWDGSSGGKPQPVGVYVFVLKVGNNNGKTQQLKGSITLIR